MTNPPVTQEAVERLIEQTFPIDEMAFTRDRAVSLCRAAIAALKSPPVVSEGVIEAALKGIKPWAATLDPRDHLTGDIAVLRKVAEAYLAMSVKSEATQEGVR